MAVSKSVTMRCDCDGCKSFADIDERTNSTGEGWYRVVLAPEGSLILTNGNNRDFCSLACLNKWSKLRAEALGESLVAKGVVYKKKPCPVCNSQVAPQGLRGHVEHTHPEENYDSVKIRYNA